MEMTVKGWSNNRHRSSSAIRNERQGDIINRALQQMGQEGLIIGSSGGCYLTVDGKKESNKVLRAHRLWKAYLFTIGMPEEQLHPTAHHLEHISDRGTVNYLDEKLGNPAKDPQGQSIS